MVIRGRWGGLSLVTGLLLACHKRGPVVLPDQTDSLDTGSQTASGPEWSVSEVGETLEASFARGLPSIAELLLHYEDAITHGDASCPAESRHLGDHDSWESVWYADSCTSEDGWTFSGEANVSVQLDPDLGTAAQTLIGNFSITHPDGITWVSGGHSELAAEAGEAWSASMQVSGIYHEDEATDWLGLIESTLLLVEATRDSTGLRVEIDGGIGFAEHHVDFHALHFEESCIDQPTGRLGLRDAGGAWYDLMFEEPCSGCARVTWQGQDLGELCLDTSGWAEQLARGMGDG